MPERPRFIFTWLFVVALSAYFLGILDAPSFAPARADELVVGALGAVASLELLLKHVL